jgi:hypothetical protein
MTTRGFKWKSQNSSIEIFEYFTTQATKLSSTMKGYKSSEKVLDSSSSDDEERIHSPTLLRRSLSPASSSLRSSPSPSPSSSPFSGSSSNSSSRSPSPDLSSYQYQPPSSHTLSTSKEKSALPALRSNDELFLLRIPRGIALDNAQFNFRKRKVRIGEEEWKLLDEETGSVKLIQPQENSEKFEFGMRSRSMLADLGAVSFSMGLNVVRDVQIPTLNGGQVQEETVPQVEKKRKRDKEDTDHEKRRKHGEEKHKEKKKKQREKDKSETKDKARDKDKESHKEKHHKSGKDGKHKSEKHKHKHS